MHGPENSIIKELICIESAIESLFEVFAKFDKASDFNAASNQRTNGPTDLRTNSSDEHSTPSAPRMWIVNILSSLDWSFRDEKLLEIRVVFLRREISGHNLSNASEMVALRDKLAVAAFALGVDRRKAARGPGGMMAWLVGCVGNCCSEIE
mmetsp:Transcript_28840/g.55714  ORF Transcript_28840/g.55714 Transcript_28840/m.55714 type:complete len:151 (+) Transcript_28840:578-1030(+)